MTEPETCLERGYQHSIPYTAFNFTAINCRKVPPQVSSFWASTSVSPVEVGIWWFSSTKSYREIGSLTIPYVLNHHPSFQLLSHSPLLWQWFLNLSSVKQLSVYSLASPLQAIALHFSFFCYVSHYALPLLYSFQRYIDISCSCIIFCPLRL